MEALSLGLIAALAWGIHDILVRHVSQKLGILISLFAVLVFGVVAQIPMFLLFNEASDTGTEAIWLSIAAGVAFSAACIGHYNAFHRGPVRIVAPVIGCYSILAFIVAAFSGANVTAAQWMALAILIIGIALVTRSPRDGLSNRDVPPLTGTLGYCGLAICGFAATFALGQSASAAGDPLTSGLITRMTTVLIVGTLLLQKSLAHTGKTALPNTRALSLLALMGILDAIALGAVLAAGVFQRPEFASAGSSIFGLVTVVLAWAFLREKISTTQWIGVVLVFAAIAYLAAG